MEHYFIGNYHEVNQMSIIKIAEEFTDSPGARYETDGEFSGQEFREKLLKPRFDALEPGEILEIDFDGTFGYPPSFLEEAFGGLIREVEDPKKVEERLKFKADERPDIIIKVKKFIQNAISNR
jgi:hypothetical protein